MKKVGINGIAGRIGKFAAYELVQLGEVIGAVNDLASTDNIIASLSHKDGVHGSLDWEVKKISDKMITINGDEVRVYHEKDPADISWGKEVVAVDECTGFFIEREAAERHFIGEGGLETVVISAPGKGDMNFYVMGVNHTDYQKGTEKDKIISNASCTTKALAVPMKVLVNAGFEVYGVLMDTTHAATNTSKPLDFMATYGALDTIQSAKTGAAIATGKVIPILDGLMDGFAMRVPTRDGSFANIYLVAEAKGLSANNTEVVAYINSLFENAVLDPRYVGRIDVHGGGEISSPDIIGNTASSVVSLSKTKVLGIPLPAQKELGNGVALIGFVSGYDNERGPAMDLAMLTQYAMNK